jgi:hypothetical protein
VEAEEAVEEDAPISTWKTKTKGSEEDAPISTWKTKTKGSDGRCYGRNSQRRRFKVLKAQRKCGED